MKIALCLHGMFDSPMDTTSNGLDGREYIQKHIMDKGDVDVFIHSWDLEKQGLIEAMYQPKKAIFEPQKDFSELIKERGLDKLEGCPRSPQSVLSHLYSVTEVMKLPHQQTGVKYDIIIIGSGISGLYAAYNIKKMSPETTFLILEKYQKKWIGGRTSNELFYET